MKKLFPIIGVIVLILVAGWLILDSDGSVSSSGETLGESGNSTTLFYGDTCPHCHVVIDWLDKNSNIKEASGVVYKEVYKNQANARMMTQRAEECEINTQNGVGVPFLYDNGQCLIGDQPIIDYLTESYK